MKSGVDSMLRRCRPDNRNYYTNEGKVAALLADIDGTMLACQIYFDQAIADFAHFMQVRGFDPEESCRVLREIDRARIESEGFERDRFGKAIIECYDLLRTENRRRFKPQAIECDKRICQQIGESPFFRDPKLFPHASAVLGRAYNNFLLIAVSMGNRDAQRYKIRQAGLSPIFDDLIVTARDDKAEIVKQIIEDWNLDPHLSAFIGNSQRSDGACLQYTNFIYLPLEHSWEFDRTRALPENTGYEVFVTRDWREAEEKAINRLLRHRRFEASSEKSHPCQ